MDFLCYSPQRMMMKINDKEEVELEEQRCPYGDRVNTAIFVR